MPINGNRNPVPLLFVLIGACGLFLAIVVTLDIANESSMSRAVHSDILSGLVIIVAGALFWIGAHAFRSVRETINAMRTEMGTVRTELTAVSKRVEKIEHEQEPDDQYAAGYADGLSRVPLPSARRLTAVPPAQ